MRGAVLNHLHDHIEDPGDRAEGWISLPEAPDSIEVTKQFVGAVDEVDDHFNFQVRQQARGFGHFK